MGIRALEFFSGIGGLHFGFNASGVKGEILDSFDMNQQANDTYALSFGKKPISRGIDRLTAKELDKYNANCWLMSPPCQPYTRGGKLLDDQDNRAKPLLHLLDQLEKVKMPPDFVFLENVKNFETSRSRARLVTLLRKLGYDFRECLLAPFHFGVPNDRLRYFLMARKCDSKDKGKVFDPDQEPIYTSWPFPTLDQDPTLVLEPFEFEIPPVSEFLDPSMTTNESCLLSEKLIRERPNFRFDILQPSSTRSSCFTKAYGSHHVAGGGGLLQTKKLEEVKDGEYDFADSDSIVELGLRFFSPSEVARLHVFPLDKEETRNCSKGSTSLPAAGARRFLPPIIPSKGPFLKFPPTMTDIQKYRLLGNSMNVWVVAQLLKQVLFKDSKVSDSLLTTSETSSAPLPSSSSRKHEASSDACLEDQAPKEKKLKE